MAWLVLAPSISLLWPEPFLACWRCWQPWCQASQEHFIFLISETRAHFLLECPVLEPLRQPLHDAARAAGTFGPLHVGPLLNDPKLLKACAKFVEASGRFA